MTARSARVKVAVQAAVAVAALSAMAAAREQDQQQPFRSGTKTVAVYTTVTDSAGRLVPNLTKDDFEIYDNGKLQPITFFAAETQPLTIAIMLDRSGSMKDNFRLVVTATEEFVRKLLPADKARIGTFAAKIHLDPEEFTNDRQMLLNVLRGELQADGPTPLWNAANYAMKELVGREGRKVLLLFTDGEDAPMNFKTNNLSVMDIVERATREDTMVYAIGLEGRPAYGRTQSPLPGSGTFGGFGGNTGAFTQRPDPGLPKIAEETGGGYFELTRADDLKATFARVADELHQQYTLGFEPSKLDGKTHKIEVKLKTKGMKARARESYVAAKPAS